MARNLTTLLILGALIAALALGACGGGGDDDDDDTGNEGFITPTTPCADSVSPSHPCHETAVTQAVAVHGDSIRAETLAVQLVPTPAAPTAAVACELNGHPVHIEIEKAGA